MKTDDFVDQLFVANTHDFILCFTNRGRVYWLKVYEVPQGTRTSRGKPVVNVFPFEEGEKISAILPVKEFADDRYIFMATARGTVKKTPLSDFSNPRKNGIIAVALDDDDVLIGAEITNGSQDVVLVSDAGKAVFDENCAACHGEDGKGIRDLGAPNLTDAVWLYGNTPEAITAQISRPQHGVMPAWQGRLPEEVITMLTVYVHNLGGGE